MINTTEFKFAMHQVLAAWKNRGHHLRVYTIPKPHKNENIDCDSTRMHFNTMPLEKEAFPHNPNTDSFHTQILETSQLFSKDSEKDESNSQQILAFKKFMNETN